MRLGRGAFLLVAGVFAAGAAPADSAVPAVGVSRAIAVQPPQLEALLQKVAQLQLNSERFSLVTRGFVLASPNRGSPGKPQRLVRNSIDGTELGEASASPQEGEIFLGSAHRPELIAIGSTLYEYEATRHGSHRRRPWVRSRNPDASPAALILPFHGGGALEVSAGG